MTNVEETRYKNVGCLKVNARRSHGVKNLASDSGRRDVVVYVSHVETEHIGAALLHVRGDDIREATEDRVFAQQSLKFSPQQFRFFWCHDFYYGYIGGGFWTELTCKRTCVKLGLFVAASCRNKSTLVLILELGHGNKKRLEYYCEKITCTGPVGVLLAREPLWCSACHSIDGF